MKKKKTNRKSKSVSEKSVSGLISEPDIKTPTINPDKIPDKIPDIKADIRADIKPDRIPDNEYECPECQKTFPTQKSLNGHLLKSHRIPRSKIQKNEKIDEKYTGDPYIRSLEEEKNRYKAENELLNEQLRQEQMKSRGVDLPHYRSPDRYRREEMGPLSDLSIAEYYDKKSERLKWQDDNHPKTSNDNIDLIVSMQKEMADLKKELATEKEKRTEELLKDMKDKLDHLTDNSYKTANQFTVVEKGISGLEMLGREAMQLTRERMGIEKKKPEREKIGESDSLVNKLLEVDPSMIAEE